MLWNFQPSISDTYRATYDIYRCKICQVRKEVLDACYQKSTSHLMFLLRNSYCIIDALLLPSEIETAFIIENQASHDETTFVFKNQCPQSRGKVLYTIPEKVMRTKLTLSFYLRFTILHNCFSEDEFTQNPFFVRFFTYLLPMK